jgi:acetyl-CoA carboxylase biotin carboxylase subunit
VFAPTREAAIARMERALKELVIDGVETSREFHLRVMADADYRAGRVDIQWLESRLPTLLAQQAPAETRAAAAIAAALLADRERGGRRITATPQGNASVAAPSRSPEGRSGREGSASTWAQLARLESLRS